MNLNTNQVEQLTTLFMFNIPAKEAAITTKIKYPTVTSLFRVLKAQKTRQLSPGQLGKYILETVKERTTNTMIRQRNVENPNQITDTLRTKG